MTCPSPLPKITPLRALSLNDRPAILLGMDALKLFDRVLIDFGNRRVGFDLPKGVSRATPARLAAAY